MKNPFGRSRKTDDPYVVFTSGDWEWRVLKLYQTPERALENKYARAFCAVASPYTWGDFELGDTYVKDIPGATAWLRQCVEEQNVA